jgi:16S rRNA (guanine527-N7)-methyltransferase
VNLTGARTPAERVDLLVAPVLPARRLPDPGSLLDIGSGNGSPGLVLALLRPDLEVTLLEPRAKRWAFLREAVRRAGGPAVRVLRGRHYDYPGPPVQTVTQRALALPLSEIAPLVEPGGRLVVFGGAPRLEGPFAREKAGDIHVFRRIPGDVPR